MIYSPHLHFVSELQNLHSMLQLHRPSQSDDHDANSRYDFSPARLRFHKPAFRHLLIGSQYRVCQILLLKSTRDHFLYASSASTPEFELTPLQCAANATSGGKRSGQSVASNSNSSRFFLLICIRSSLTSISAPASNKASTIFLSACVEVLFNPITNASPAIAPATKRNAPPDQSPST